ncbi:MAG: helix-hairpin-helix domain-containing protein [Proteobacteria bacterium]|nr:helix-hairpin-helix domain-containing protein [Pseudomonadota bacterium]
MKRRLARLAVATALVVAAVARGSISAPRGPVGGVEVVVDGEAVWVHPDGRSVDAVLLAAGHPLLGVGLQVPPGEYLVRRGDGWAIEASAQPLPLGAQVDLNRVPVATLLGLPGIGPSRAAALVGARPFRSTEDIVHARGVGPAALAKLEGLVSVQEGAFKPLAPPIDVNCASETTLLGLPRVGPVLARRIVAARPFSSLDGLVHVKGIGPATLDRLRSTATAGRCP